MLIIGLIKDGYFTGVLLLLFVECSVCIVKRPFSLHNFRQYTNMSARVCLCLRMLLASLHTTSASSSSFASIINEKKKHICFV